MLQEFGSLGVPGQLRGNDGTSSAWIGNSVDLVGWFSGSRIGGSLDFPSGLGQTLDSVRDSGVMGFRLAADAQGEYRESPYRDLAQAVFSECARYRLLGSVLACLFGRKGV